MKQEVVNKLSVFYRKNPTMLGKAATNEQIANAKKNLIL